MLVRLCSRLGNQMFMYAFGRGLAAKTGKSVQFFWRDEQNRYELYPYPIAAELAPTPTWCVPEYREKQFTFDPAVYEQPDNTQFNGCWQSEKYFEHIADDIRRELTLPVPVPGVESLWTKPESVAVHVRRGDYLNPSTSAYHGNLGKDYYDAAQQYVRERVPNARFYIFSDDPEWCSQNMQGEVISGKYSAHEDIALMSQCSHNIIANSSFSWWAAWLGNPEGRIVVAPKRWFNQAPLDYSDVVPERWIKL